ncbi:MAG: hypothetical protein CSB02_00225 [Bacteroidia bacterium]|nr:MAG: hypothetical protein CSB02_00225 [Bacteroidia bacterium]
MLIFNKLFLLKWMTGLALVACVQLDAYTQNFDMPFDNNTTNDSLQSNTFITSSDVFVVQDTKVDTLLAMHKIINSVDTLIEGYRVQIFFAGGNFSKDKAQQKLDEFVLEHEAHKAYLSFKAPYYRVRVGDFRTVKIKFVSLLFN